MRRPRALPLAIASGMLFSQFAVAEQAIQQAVDTMPTGQDSAATNSLPKITLTAQKKDKSAYVAKSASSVLKSDAPLFETAQSVSVITREQLDQKQAITLADALDGVAGVVAAPLGRRGWDDYIIRGQTVSDQTFIDGLRQGQGIFVAAELSGLDQVQVLKGPASVNFGLVLPGGMVNLVTKRPQATDFNRASFTYGSQNLREFSFDTNMTGDNGAKGALRLNGKISEQDDATDDVYFKNRWISPSYNFDLGENTELSVIGSYQYREYMRQQGLPVIGSLLANPNGALPRELFIGEPSHGAYEAEVYRAGYNLKHDFGSDLIFKQAFAVQKTGMVGPAVFFSKWTQTDISKPGAYTTLARQARYQDVDNLSFSVDNSLQKTLQLAGMQHELTVGIDAMRDKNDYLNNRCTVGNLDLYDPQYGQTVSCPAAVTNHDINYLSYVGLYLKDRSHIIDKLIVSLAGRHDWSRTESRDQVKNVETKRSEQAFSGNAALLYNLNDVLAPYASYATSFFPVVGTSFSGDSFKPETGKQLEVGFKVQSPDKRMQGSVSWFDLKRQNVTAADPVNSGFNVQTGEQLTRGVEMEFAAVLLDALNVLASYTYTPDAKITSDTTAANLGKRLNNVPEQAYSLSARYSFPQGSLQGWYVGAGLRGETEKQGYSFDYTIPGYTVFDAELGYNAGLWGLSVAARNLFDKDYYAGALNQYMITMGNQRQVNLNLKLNF